MLVCVGETEIIFLQAEIVYIYILSLLTVIQESTSKISKDLQQIKLSCFWLHVFNRNFQISNVNL